MFETKKTLWLSSFYFKTVLQMKYNLQIFSGEDIKTLRNNSRPTRRDRRKARAGKAEGIQQEKEEKVYQPGPAAVEERGTAQCSGHDQGASVLPTPAAQDGGEHGGAER